MNAARLSPSMMCADICATGDALRVFSEAGVEYLHIDIMDGHFVPNFTLGPNSCRQLLRSTDIPLDIHMMVESPEDKLDWFPDMSGGILSVHVETCAHLQRALERIRKKGCKAFAALNPATPYEGLRWVLDDLDGVLLLAVNPGFAGQRLVPQTIVKISECRRWLDDLGCKDMALEVDGNVSLENAAKMRAAGADIFVGGTSALFKDGRVTRERIEALRRAIRSGERL